MGKRSKSNRAAKRNANVSVADSSKLPSNTKSLAPKAETASSNSDALTPSPVSVERTSLVVADPFSTDDDVRGREDSLVAVSADSTAETHFFSQPPPAVAADHHFHVPPSAEEIAEARRSQAHLAQAKVRRAHFARHVGWAVAVSLAICVAGGFRAYIISSRPQSVASTFEGEARAAGEASPLVVPVVEKAVDPTIHAEAKKPAEVTSAAMEAPKPVDPVANVANVPEAPKAVEAVKAAEVAPAQVKPKEEAKPAAPAAAEPKVEEAVKAELKPGSAVEDKKTAQRALDRGKIKDAIAAGESSVASDPTDGDAWLVLGAAYQMAGRDADARKAFQSCSKQGKRGRMGECRAMLH